MGAVLGLLGRLQPVNRHGYILPLELRDAIKIFLYFTDFSYICNIWDIEINLNEIFNFDCIIYFLTSQNSKYQEIY